MPFVIARKRADDYIHYIHSLDPHEMRWTMNIKKAKLFKTEIYAEIIIEEFVLPFDSVPLFVSLEKKGR